jgi:hypothetical protein
VIARHDQYSLLLLYSSDRFYDTAAEEHTTGDANPLYTGAMASVPSICEAIEHSLKLNEAGEPHRTG